MSRDVGSYFEKLTKRGRGGRRPLDEPASDTSSQTTRSDRPTTRSTRSSGRASGVTDALKDATSRGRSAAKKGADRIRSSRRSGSRPAGGAKAAAVLVEYSPRLDGDPDPGEVVWTWVPFEEDPDQGKDRPVVVIGRRGGKLVGVPLTSRRSDREVQVAIGTGGWDPKRRRSYARIWRMLDFDADGMRREGSILDRKRFDEVIESVDQYYEVKYPSAVDSDFDYDY